MSDTVISVENVSKRYIIGHETARGDGLRHAVESAVRSPGRWLKSVNEKRRSSKEEFWALRDLNFEVEHGAVTGIIGRNGAGKSTILKILSRITAPTTGRIRLNGRVASLLEVGTGFHPELTGRENIYLNGAILGMGRHEIARKFDEIVDFAGVERFLDTPVKRYSSGMYVRLAFAVAAHLEPDILIVDEVLAVGDVEFQKKCLARMDKVAHEGGRTILFVSHNMAAIEGLCNRAVLLHRGEKIADGSPRAVISEYLSKLMPSLVPGGSLASVTDRSGNGVIRLTRFRVEDGAGRPLEQLVSGAEVDFIFDYEIRGPSLPRNVDAGFSVSTEDERLLFVIYSSYCGRILNPKHRTGSFRCRVERFPLAAGRYLVGARVLADGDEADWPKNGVGYIQVEAGDFYRSGSSGFQAAGLFLVDGTWSEDRAGEEGL
ncbi:MAG: ABC transporter ATP-binding protein [Opitutaceae bacterium]